MTITPHQLENEDLAEKLSMIIVGSEKAGKSRLAATAPKPVLFLDFDQRAQSLAGMSDVFALSFADPTNTSMQPTAFNELLSTLAKLERSLSLHELGFLGASPDKFVKTIVFDSIVTVANSARAYALYCNPKELAYVINIGGRQFRTPSSWHGWTSEMAMVEGAILQALAIQGLNVIVTLHESSEEAPGSTEANPIYTGHIEVYPVRYRSLLKYFNEVWRVTRETGQTPTVSVQPDGRFTKASTALGITSVVTPNISSVIQQARSVAKPQLVSSGGVLSR